MCGACGAQYSSHGRASSVSFCFRSHAMERFPSSAVRSASTIVRAFTLLLGPQQLCHDAAQMVQQHVHPAPTVMLLVGVMHLGGWQRRYADRLRLKLLRHTAIRTRR